MKKMIFVVLFCCAVLFATQQELFAQEEFFLPLDARLRGTELFVLYGQCDTTGIEGGNFLGVFRQNEGVWELQEKLLEDEIWFAHTLNFGQVRGKSVAAISDCRNNRAILTTRTGRIVWDSSNFASLKGRINLPNDVEINQEGTRLLISTRIPRGGAQLIEVVISDGTISWEYTPHSEIFDIHDCDYLPNGNILYVASGREGGGRIIEVTREGEEAWYHQAGPKDFVRNAEVIGKRRAGSNYFQIFEIIEGQEVVFFDFKEHSLPDGLYNFHCYSGGVLTTNHISVSLISWDATLLWELRMLRGIVNFQETRELKALGYIQ